MSLSGSVARLGIFAIVVAWAYYRYSEHFFNLASATDSKRTTAFWTVVALIFAALVAASYIIFYFVF
jgi:hypothetical protein